MIEFTGERVVPGQTDPDLLNEHVARYRFAEALVRGKRVLDAGCGVGYGSARLAKVAEQVAGIDYASDALQAAAPNAGKNLHFAQGDCSRLPFSSASFDAVVAFEVVEHLEDWRGLLAESKRVLAPAGQLIISTPNRLFYGETRSEPNPFHVHEFDYREFRHELEQIFPHTIIFFQNHAGAITFTPSDIQGVRTALEAGPGEPDEAHFFVAVSSSEPLFGSPAFVYLPKSANLLRERDRHIRLLEGELRQKDEWLDTARADLSELSAIHAAQQVESQQAIDALEAENRKKTEWIQAREKELLDEIEKRTAWARDLEKERAGAIEKYKKLDAESKEAAQLLDKAEKTVIERTEWAQRLDRELEQIRAELANLHASPAVRIGRRLGLAPKPATPRNGG